MLVEGRNDPEESGDGEIEAEKVASNNGQWTVFDCSRSEFGRKIDGISPVSQIVYVLLGIINKRKVIPQRPNKVEYDMKSGVQII